MVSRRAQIIAAGISQEVSHTRTQSDCIHIYRPPKESFILSATGVPGNSTFMGVLCELSELTGEVYTAVSPAGAPTRMSRYIAVSNWLEDVAEACYPQLPALGVALQHAVAHEHATRACELALATAFRRIGVSRQCARGWLYPRDDSMYASLQ